MDDLYTDEDTPREAWERVIGPGEEGSEAYQAFSRYRDMDLPRSLAQVGRSLGKSKTLMDRWSSTYRWVERVKAYDDFLDKQIRAINEKKRREMQQRHATMGQMIQGKAFLFLQKL